MKKNQTRSFLKKMTSLLVAAIMLMSVFTVSLATTAFADDDLAGIYEVTTADANGNLNLREEPNGTSEILTKIPNHTPLTIYGVENGMGYTGYNGFSGWVSMSYVANLGDFTDYPTGTYKVNLRDASSHLIIREGNDVAFKILGQIPHNTVITINQTDFGWGKVTYGNVTGWVCMSYLLAQDVDEMVNGHEVGTYNVSITSGTLNLRQTPSMSAAVLTSIPNNTALAISQVSGDWGYTSYNGKNGWVNFQYLSSGNDNSSTHSTGDYKVSTSSTALNIRASAGTYGLVIGSVPKNTVVKVTSVSGNWGYITYNGTSGWVCFDFLVPVSGSDSDTDTDANTNSDTTYTTGTYTVTTASTGLNMRAEPNESATIIASIPKNTVISVTQVNGNWGYTTYDGKSGWVCFDYLTAGGTLSSDTDFATGTYTVTTISTGLNMRAEPNPTAAIVCSIPRGTTLNITDVNGNWGYTTYNSKSGWVCFDYLTAGGVVVESDTDATDVDYSTGTYIIELSSNSSTLNMRKTASSQGEVVQSIFSRAVVIIKEVSGNWGFCTYNGKSGWVNMQYLVKLTSFTGYTKGLYQVTTEDATGNLNIRPTASTEGVALGMIPNGEEITVTEIGGPDSEWGYVSYNDVEGWVFMIYTTLIESYELDTDTSDTDTDSSDTDTDSSDTDDTDSSNGSDTDTNGSDTDSNGSDTDSSNGSDTDSDKKGILYGDVNVDGTVTMLDVTEFQRVVASLTTMSAQGKINADVNGDGKRNMEDIVLIQRFKANLISKFPVEQM